MPSERPARTSPSSSSDRRSISARWASVSGTFDGDPAQAIPELADEVELLAGRQAFYINHPLRHGWILLPIPPPRNGSMPDTIVAGDLHEVVVDVSIRAVSGDR